MTTPNPHPDADLVRASAELVEAAAPIVTPVVDRASDVAHRLLGRVADASGLVVATSGVALSDWISFLLGAPTSATPSMSGEIMRFFRENTAETFKAAAAAAEARGVELRPIERQALFNIIDEARRTDDGTLRAAWADLLVSECETPGAAHPMIVSALARLSGEDARELRRIAQDAAARGERESEPLFGDEHVRYGPVARLASLGLVYPRRSSPLIDVPEPKSEIMPPGPLCPALSTLGAAFVDAVMPGILPPAT